MKKIVLACLFAIQALVTFPNDSISRHDRVMRELCKGTGIVFVDQVDTTGTFRVEVLDSLLRERNNKDSIMTILINAQGEFMLGDRIYAKDELLNFLTTYNHFSQKSLIVLLGYDDGVFGHETTTPVHLVEEIGSAIVGMHERRMRFLSEQYPTASLDDLCKNHPFIVINDEITLGWCLMSRQPIQLPIRIELKGKEEKKSKNIEEEEDLRPTIQVYQDFCNRNLKLYKSYRGPDIQTYQKELLKLYKKKE